MADTSTYAATFQLIDTNQDGKIDSTEFAALMTALGGPTLDPQVAASMFSGMDSDQDGQISLDELAGYLDSASPAANSDAGSADAGSADGAPSA